jgi:hypothetical protein
MSYLIRWKGIRMRRLDQFQEVNDTTLVVGGNSTVSQTVTPTRNNFSAVRLYVFNPNLGGKALYTISILDEYKNIIRTSKISESNLGWAYSYRYDFIPIPDSKNKTLTVIISYDGSQIDQILPIEELNKEKTKVTSSTLSAKLKDEIQKKFIGLAYANGDNFPGGSAYAGTTKLPGDLVFQTYYSTSLSAFISDSLNDFKMRLIQDKSFLLFYILLMFVLVTVLTLRLKRRSHITK